MSYLRQEIPGRRRMIILDTCVMVYDALEPEKLSKMASEKIREGLLTGRLACSDISLWELAMLINRGRLKPDADPLLFIRKSVAANRLKVLPITPEIAILANTCTEFGYGDPADRIIAATAMYHKATLITCDSMLLKIKGLNVIW